MQGVAVLIIVATLVAALSISTAAEMSTSNAMPANTGNCMTGPCGQGALMASAVTFDATDATISFVNANDFSSSSGWPAGTVTAADAKSVYLYADKVCHQKLRGVTVLKILQALVGTSAVDPGNGGVTGRKFLQYSGVRATYSTTLPAAARLTKAEWWDKDAGAYVPLDRTKVYGVNILKFDTTSWSMSPYKSWWADPSLTGESSDCGAYITPGVLVTAFLEANSPYTVPELPSSRLLSESEGTAIVVDQDGAYCKGLTPPEFYDAAVYSCQPCPAGQAPNAAGTACAAAAPVTGAPVTTAPVAPVTDTPIAPTVAPVTPVTTAPAAPITGSPADPGTAAPASAATTPPAAPSSGSSAAPGTASPSATPASGSASASGEASGSPAPSATSLPPQAPAAGKGGAASGAGAAEAKGAPIGAIVGGVVGAIALLAVVAVAVFMMKKKAARAEATDGLEERLSPTDEQVDVRLAATAKHPDANLNVGGSDII